jgi:tartrate/fumarate subfamily iron-sulfur-dependent hydro-lyase alpha chain
MITATDIAAAVEQSIAQSSSVLRPDVYDALVVARTRETNERGRWVLDQLIENAAIAARDDVPLCQDTGTVWVRLEVGEDSTLPPKLQQAIDAAVTRVYAAQALRASTVRDAVFDRSNPGTNTPAFLEIAQRAGTGITVHTLLKGAGSDNASRVLMLSPHAGIPGIKDALLQAVAEKASMACPPLIIGIGIGTTFDKVATLAKRALLHPVGSPAASPQHAHLEHDLLAAVNATGIGPGALGGDTTALAVHVETAPCHIAALPLAINLGCCATRSRSVLLT